jgi:hypothetical protein
MATTRLFGGKLIKLPGVYSRIVSGINSTPINTDYGKVLIIDTGLFAGYAGGPGVTGTLKQGTDSLYEFKDLGEARNIIRGGVGWKLLEKLYKPYKDQPGISSLYFIKANTTTQASMSFTATGGGAKGGTFAFKTLDEGKAANGVLESEIASQEYGSGAIGLGELDGDKLVMGYGWSIATGIVDNTKWIFQVWRGSYTGVHTDGISISGVTLEGSAPILVCQSPEFNNIQDLIDWAQVDYDFNQHFAKGSCTVTGDGSINQADVTAVAGYNKATGATETYNAADLTTALEVVQGLSFTHVLCDKYGTSQYNSATVGAIVAHLETDAKGDKYMFYGGGKDRTEFSSGTGSLAQAAYFDTNRVLVCHGDALESSNLAPTGFRQWPTVYKAAAVLGRTAGLPPQVPVTNKAIGIDGEVHKLSDKQKEQALDGGVLTTFYDSDFKAVVVTEGINTLQVNRDVIRADGKSFSHQAERIKSQVNANITYNGKIDLMGQPNGVNAVTLSAQYVKDWTGKQLEAMKADPSTGKDNLILSYQDITVTQNQDTWDVTYGFGLNGERTKIFFTGVVLSF